LPTKTDTQVKKDELAFLSNRISFFLKLSATKTKLDFIDISSPVFPWLTEDSRIRESLIEGIRIGIENSKKKGKIESTDLNNSVSKEISKVLGSFESRVNPELIISVEEHGPNAMQVQDDVNAIEKIEYRAIVDSNTKKMSSADLQISLPDGTLIFNLDDEKRQSNIAISVTSDCFLSRVEIGSSDEVFCEREYSLILRKRDKNKLSLPVMPVRHYRKIAETGKVQLVFVMVKGKRISGQVKANVPNVSGVYASWFLDMGSTQVKDFEVEWSQSPNSSQVSNEAKRVFRDLLTNAKIEATESFPTKKFIQMKQLPRYDKAKLVSAGESIYANWISSCVYKISSDLLQKGKYLHSIHFSMPQVDGLSISKVQKLVIKETEPYVIDAVYLVSEHDALRARFGKVLTELSKTAKMEKSRTVRIKQRNNEKSAKKENLKRDYLKKKAKYDSRNWFSKIFNSDPRKPDYSVYAPEGVPTLRQWHRRMLKIKASEDLSEVIIFDAGGYSFDIYAKIAGKTFGESFTAGGVHLTEMIKESSEKKGAKLTWASAERKKIVYCRASLDRKDRHNIGSYTKDIYSEPLMKIVKWLNKTSGKRIGVPMILSGGGFNNPYLRELVVDTLSKAGIAVEPLTSTDITNMIEINKVDTSNKYHDFLMITYRYLQDTEPKISHDICGGMLESYQPKSYRGSNG